MKHLTEEQLVLHYYGEADNAGHLEDCATCQYEYRELARLLDACREYPVPERAANYEQLLWQRVSPGLVKHQPWWRSPWILAPALAGLLTVSFFAGRVSTPKAQPANIAGTISTQGREKILLVAMGDHLERSQMVLVEIANAKSEDSSDMRVLQQRARDLVGENRLYRQTAMLAGDNEFTNVLDDLERVLTDIAQGPSDLSSPELEQIQRRIESRGLIFKIRVIDSNLKQKGTEKL